MAAENDPSGPGRGNLLDTMLKRVRERYVEEHGEEPPDGFMDDARDAVLRKLAKKGRDEHRDIYDGLADE